MKENDLIENANKAIYNNPLLFSKIFSLCLLMTGILAVVGAIKDWDWLYKPDDSYHNWYSIKQVSRYLGRGTARVVGFAGGIVIILAGAAWSFSIFFKK